MEKESNAIILNKCKKCENIPLLNIKYENERLIINYNCTCSNNDNIEKIKEISKNEKIEIINNSIDIDEIVKEIQDTNESLNINNDKIIKELKEYNNRNNEVDVLKNIIKNMNSSEKYKQILDKLNTLKLVLSYEEKILSIFKDTKKYKLVNEYPILTKDGIKNEIFVSEYDNNDYYYNLNLDSDEKHLKEDAVKKSAYDNNENTLFKYNDGNLSYSYILVDKEAIGKNVYFKTSEGYKCIFFYNQDKKIFEKDTRALYFNYKIPQNSTKMCFYCNEGAGCFQMSIK